MSGVSDGSLAAQPVALLQVEGVLPVRVVSRLQLLPCQVGFIVEGAQLTLLLRPGGLGHLRDTRGKVSLNIHLYVCAQVTEQLRLDVQII